MHAKVAPVPLVRRAIEFDPSRERELETWPTYFAPLSTMAVAPEQGTAALLDRSPSRTSLFKSSPVDAWDSFFGPVLADLLTDALPEALRWPPRRRNWQRLSSLISSQMRSQFPAVGVFLEGLITYAISRTWHDLMATYVLGLHPKPFCEGREGDDVLMPCTPTASAATQLAYAFVVVVCGAALAQALLRVRRVAQMMGFMTSMIGMVAGWALGDALTAMQSELRLAYPGLCIAPKAAPLPMTDSRLASNATEAATDLINLLLMKASPPPPAPPSPISSESIFAASESS